MTKSQESTDIRYIKKRNIFGRWEVRDNLKNKVISTYDAGPDDQYMAEQYCKWLNEQENNRV